MPTIEQLTTIPRKKGKPLYPNRNPIDVSEYIIGTGNVQQLLIKSAALPLEDKELNALKEYLVYYINAPCFNDGSDEYKIIIEHTNKLELELTYLDDLFELTKQVYPHSKL